MKTWTFSTGNPNAQTFTLAGETIREAIQSAGINTVTRSFAGPDVPAVGGILEWNLEWTRTYLPEKQGARLLVVYEETTHLDRPPERKTASVIIPCTTQEEIG